MAEGPNPALEGIKQRVATLRDSGSLPDPKRINRIHTGIQSVSFTDKATGSQAEFKRQKKGSETTRTPESTAATWAFRIVADQLADTEDFDIQKATTTATSPEVKQVLRDVLQKLEGDNHTPLTYRNVLRALQKETMPDRTAAWKVMAGQADQFPSGFANAQEAEALVRRRFYKNIKAAIQQRRNVVPNRDAETHTGDHLNEVIHNMARHLGKISLNKTALAERVARIVSNDVSGDRTTVLKTLGIGSLFIRHGEGPFLIKMNPNEADFDQVDSPTFQALTKDLFGEALKDADRMINTAQLPARDILMGHAAGESKPGTLVSRDEGVGLTSRRGPDDSNEYPIVPHPNGTLAPVRQDQPVKIPEIKIEIPPQVLTTSNNGIVRQPSEPQQEVNINVTPPPTGERPALPNGQSATQSGPENTNHAPTSPSEGDGINYRIVDDPALRTRLDTFRGSDGYRRGSDYLARQFGGKEQIVPKKEGETEAVYQGRFLAELDGRIRTPEKYASNDPILAKLRELPFSDKRLLAKVVEADKMVAQDASRKETIDRLRKRYEGKNPNFVRRSVAEMPDDTTNAEGFLDYYVRGQRGREDSLYMADRKGEIEPAARLDRIAATIVSKHLGENTEVTTDYLTSLAKDSPKTQAVIARICGEITDTPLTFNAALDRLSKTLPTSRSEGWHEYKDAIALIRRKLYDLSEDIISRKNTIDINVVSGEGINEGVDDVGIAMVKHLRELEQKLSTDPAAKQNLIDSYLNTLSNTPVTVNRKDGTTTNMSTRERVKAILSATDSKGHSVQDKLFDNLTDFAHKGMDRFKSSAIRPERLPQKGDGYITGKRFEEGQEKNPGGADKGPGEGDRKPPIQEVLSDLPIPPATETPTAAPVTSETGDELPAAPDKDPNKEPAAGKDKPTVAPVEEPGSHPEKKPLMTNANLSVVALHDAAIRDAVSGAEYVAARDLKRFQTTNSFVGGVWQAIRHPVKHIWQNALAKGIFNQQRLRFVSDLEATLKLASKTDNSVHIELTKDIIDAALAGGEDLRSSSNWLQKFGWRARDFVVGFTGGIQNSEQVLAKRWLENNKTTVADDQKTKSVAEATAKGKQFALYDARLEADNTKLDVSNRNAISAEIGESRDLLSNLIGDKQVITDLNEKVRELVRAYDKNPDDAALLGDFNAYFIDHILPRIPADRQKEFKANEYAGNIVAIAQEVHTRFGEYTAGENGQTPLEKLELTFLVGKGDWGGDRGKDSMDVVNMKLAKDLNDRHFSRNKAKAENAAAYLINTFKEVGYWGGAFALGFQSTAQKVGLQFIVGPMATTGVVAALREGGVVRHIDGRLYGFGGRFIGEQISSGKALASGREAPVGAHKLAEMESTRVHRESAKALIDNITKAKESGNEAQYLIALAHVAERVHLTDLSVEEKMRDVMNLRLALKVPQQFIGFTEGQSNAEYTALRDAIFNEELAISLGADSARQRTELSKAKLVMEAQLRKGSDAEKMKGWLTQKGGMSEVDATAAISTYFGTTPETGNLGLDNAKGGKLSLETAMHNLAWMNLRKMAKAGATAAVLTPVIGTGMKAITGEIGEAWRDAHEVGGVGNYGEGWIKALSRNYQIVERNGHMVSDLSPLQRAIFGAHEHLAMLRDRLQPNFVNDTHPDTISGMSVNLPHGIEHTQFNNHDVLVDLRSGRVMDITGLQLREVTTGSSAHLSFFDSQNHEIPLSSPKLLGLGASSHFTNITNATPTQPAPIPRISQPSLTTVNSSTPVLSPDGHIDPSGELGKYATHINRMTWRNNDTDFSDKYELGLHTIKNADGSVDLRLMGHGTTTNANLTPQTIDPAAIMGGALKDGQGKLGYLVTTNNGDHLFVQSDNLHATLGPNDNLYKALINKTALNGAPEGDFHSEVTQNLRPVFNAHTIQAGWMKPGNEFESWATIKGGNGALPSSIDIPVPVEVPAPIEIPVPVDVVTQSTQWTITPGDFHIPWAVFPAPARQEVERTVKAGSPDAASVSLPIGKDTVPAGTFMGDQITAETGIKIPEGATEKQIDQLMVDHLNKFIQNASEKDIAEAFKDLSALTPDRIQKLKEDKTDRDKFVRGAAATLYLQNKQTAISEISAEADFYTTLFNQIPSDSNIDRAVFDEMTVKDGNGKNWFEKMNEVVAKVNESLNHTDGFNELPEEEQKKRFGEELNRLFTAGDSDYKLPEDKRSEYFKTAMVAGGAFDKMVEKRTQEMMVEVLNSQFAVKPASITPPQKVETETVVSTAEFSTAMSQFIKDTPSEDVVLKLGLVAASTKEQIDEIKQNEAKMNEFIEAILKHQINIVTSDAFSVMTETQMNDLYDTALATLKSNPEMVARLPEEVKLMLLADEFERVAEAIIKINKEFPNPDQNDKDQLKEINEKLKAELGITEQKEYESKIKVYDIINGQVQRLAFQELLGRPEVQAKLQVKLSEVLSKLATAPTIPAEAQTPVRAVSDEQLTRAMDILRLDTSVQSLLKETYNADEKALNGAFKRAFDNAKEINPSSIEQTADLIIKTLKEQDRRIHIIRTPRQKKQLNDMRDKIIGALTKAREQATNTPAIVTPATATPTQTGTVAESTGLIPVMDSVGAPITIGAQVRLVSESGNINTATVIALQPDNGKGSGQGVTIQLANGANTTIWTNGANGISARSNRLRIIPPATAEAESTVTVPETTSGNAAEVKRQILEKAGKRSYGEAYKLIRNAASIFEKERQAGKGKISGTVATMESSAQASHLEGFVHDNGVVFIPKSMGEVVGVGDLHGDSLSLEQILTKSNFIERVERGDKVMLVGMGDYVDRGKSQIRTMEILLDLKLRYPDHVVLMQADHETRGTVGEKSSFFDELQNKYSENSNVIERIYYDELFKLLPNMVIAGNGLAVVHGGIPNVQINSLTELVGNVEAFNQMTWADPNFTLKEGLEPQWRRTLDKDLNGNEISVKDRMESARRMGLFTFSKKALVDFLGNIGARAMITGHRMGQGDGFNNWNKDLPTNFYTIHSTGEGSSEAEDKFAAGVDNPSYFRIDLREPFNAIDPAKHIVSIWN